MSRGHIKGATKFQGRDAIVVEITGTMAIAGPAVELASDIHGYRIIDRDTRLLLASVARIELVGKIDGKTSGITLTRSVSTQLE
jgi:hypothetical protein